MARTKRIGISVFELPLIKIMRRAYLHCLFEGFPDELEKQVGDAAGPLLKEISRKSFLEVIEEEPKLKEAIKQFKSVHEASEFCYKMLELMGFDFEYEVLKETETEYQQKITVCPYMEFTKKNPLACNVCCGMKIAILQTFTGKDVEMETVETMARGSACCSFKVKY